MNESVSSQPVIAVPKNKISKIWLLPIIAVLIGIAMIYNNWQNRGIDIQITFNTAEGLVAGQTKLKNREVEIGTVNAVSFSKDKKSIVVDIKVEREMQDFLVSDSKFWVVRPRIGPGGISGISTLLSGAYIQIVPGSSDEFHQEFIGLERPLISAINNRGIHVNLISSGGKSLRIGNPVIYRGFEVGKIEAYEFDTKTRQAKYSIFIQAPYDELVTTNTEFWNAGGLSIKTSTQGITVDVATLDTLIAGGIEFDVPEGADIGTNIISGANFKLFESKQSIADSRQYTSFDYALLLEESISGLEAGSPVEYQGIRIGTVGDPILFDQLKEIANIRVEERVPVIIHIEPERLSKNSKIDLQEFQKIFEFWIHEGLTATLETANILTGSRKISLYPTSEKQYDLETIGKYQVIPSKKSGLDNISNQVSSILAKVNNLPFASTVGQLNATLKSAEDTMTSANEMLSVLQTTLNDLQVAVDGVKPNSAVYQSLEKTMLKVQSTLDGIQPLVKEISNQPNSLVFGAAQGPDMQPQAPVKKGQ